MYLRLGDKGDPVVELQIALGITADGIFGRITEAAVKNYQNRMGKYPDGVVTPDIFEELMGEDVSSDLSESFIQGLNIRKYYLPEGEFIKEPTPKYFVFIHHTAGTHNPFHTIDYWTRDSRGRIGTHYVIGGVSSKGDTSMDGQIVEAINPQYWAYHLGKVDANMHKTSLSIELCSWGGLKKTSKGFENYVGGVVPENQVVELKSEFRGFKFYHKYSDKQLASLKLLLDKLSKDHSIDYSSGLKEWLLKFPDEMLAFDYFLNAASGKIRGLLSHTNVRKDKSDVYPDKRLVNIIKNL